MGTMYERINLNVWDIARKEKNTLNNTYAVDLKYKIIGDCDNISGKKLKFLYRSNIRRTQ